MADPYSPAWLIGRVDYRFAVGMFGGVIEWNKFWLTGAESVEAARRRKAPPLIAGPRSTAHLPLPTKGDAAYVRDWCASRKRAVVSLEVEQGSDQGCFGRAAS